LVAQPISLGAGGRKAARTAALEAADPGLDRSPLAQDRRDLPRRHWHRLRERNASESINRKGWQESGPHEPVAGSSKKEQGMSKSLVDLAKEYSAAWAEHDPDAIAAMHTEDSVFEMHNIHAPATGREAVRALIAILVAAVPDVHFQPTRAHFGADHFVTEYVMSGTAEGKRFAIAGADVLTIRDGLVARKDSYLDWLSYQRQVGFDPATKFDTIGR
jgi:ketosteroid isomerase-like protein